MTERSNLEHDAWAAFQTRLRGYVSRRVDPASVDDVAGDVLLRLVGHRQALASADNPSAWVLRVAANAIADHHRRRQSEQRALDALQAATDAGVDAQDGTGGQPAVDEETAGSPAAALAGCLLPFIRNLPEPYREALLLTDIGGLSQKAAAERLGLSASGMKSRVQRGRTKLKQALLRCCRVEVDGRGGVIDYHRRAAPCRARC